MSIENLKVPKTDLRLFQQYFYENFPLNNLPREILDIISEQIFPFQSLIDVFNFLTFKLNLLIVKTQEEKVFLKELLRLFYSVFLKSNIFIIPEKFQEWQKLKENIEKKQKYSLVILDTYKIPFKYLQNIVYPVYDSKNYNPLKRYQSILIMTEDEHYQLMMTPKLGKYGRLIGGRRTKKVNIKDFVQLNDFLKWYEAFGKK